MTNKTISTIGMRALICAPLLLLVFARCEPHEPQTSPPPTPCTNGIKCINNPEAGACADKIHSKCVPSDAGADSGKECLYNLSIDAAGCVCIEKESRTCEDAGVFGYQKCELKDSGPGTRWAACQPF